MKTEVQTLIENALKKKKIRKQIAKLRAELKALPKAQHGGLRPAAGAPRGPEAKLCACGQYTQSWASKTGHTCG